MRTASNNIPKMVAKIAFAHKFFPVYSNDTLESVVKRFEAGYPDLAKCMVEDVKAEQALYTNDEGMSKVGLTRTAMKIPIPVMYAMKFLDDDYWNKKNTQHYREFMALCPKLSSGKGV